ncbi:MAG: transglycosylase SLT domain-containing protein [Pseudolabrys sp.]
MSVASVLSSAASKITGAISQAARSTGISFEYLVTTAQIESRFNPKAQAPTSSASGLYQFIDQTWLGTLKRAGPSLGLGQYANAISKSADGRYTVSDPKMRDAIMKLRHDPRASALMAGAFTRSNEARLESAIGRQPSEGELYIAHFLGSEGASKLISAAANRPQTSAVDMFPRAARANHSVFYSRSGAARSVAGVYREINRRYQMARNVAFNHGLLRGSIDPVTGATGRLMPASASASVAAGQAMPVVASASAFALGAAPVSADTAQAYAALPQAVRADPVRVAQALAAMRGTISAVPDPAATTQAFAVARHETLPAAPTPAAATESTPFFRSIFSDRGGAPVTPTVQRLWATTGPANVSQATAKTAAAHGQLNSLDLFVDHPRNSRGLFGNGKA